jgi:hypothetical protein
MVLFSTPAVVIVAENFDSWDSQVIIGKLSVGHSLIRLCYLRVYKYLKSHLLPNPQLSKFSAKKAV